MPRHGSCNFPRTVRGKKTTGNRVELVSDGSNAFERLLKMIDGAERSIDIATFVLGRDRIAEEIVIHLERKSKAGVRVRFLIDGFGALLASRSLDAIRAAGGEVESFLPHFMCKHRKIVVVDKRRAIVGGMNLAREYMGPREEPSRGLPATAEEWRWVDLELSIEGPAVRELQEVFDSDWGEPTGRFFEGEERMPGQSEVRILASSPRAGSESLHKELLQLVTGAKKRVWMATPYLVLDEEFTESLELAHRRGVDVRILLPRRSNHVLADVGRGLCVRRLEKEGVAVLLHPKMVHAKAVLVDDSCAVVGSANMDIRSFFFNDEVSAFLYSRPDVEAVSAWYSSLAKQCRRGYPKAFPGQRTLETLSTVLGPFL